MLTVVDDYSRQCLAIELDTTLPGTRVVRAMERLVKERGKPVLIRTDNGPEFVGRALDQWAYENGVRLDFIQPGKPSQNGYIESFNGKLRDECLNQHWFLGLNDARRIVANWRDDYNHHRPHTALGGRTPDEAASAVAGLRSPTAPFAPLPHALNPLPTEHNPGNAHIMTGPETGRRSVQLMPLQRQRAQPYLQSRRVVRDRRNSTGSVLGRNAPSGPHWRLGQVRCGNA